MDANHLTQDEGQERGRKRNCRLCGRDDASWRSMTRARQALARLLRFAVGGQQWRERDDR